MPDFTFRVQALGGKFLADDIGGARVTIYDAATGRLLDSGITRGNSGTLVGPPPSSPPYAPSASQIVRASKSLVTLADGSAAWWLVADPGSSAFVSSLAVDAPLRVRVKVEGPVGGLQSAGEVEATLCLVPGGAAPLLPGYVIELPGLLVQPIAPLIHTEVSPGTRVDFTAKVTMMCGCQVAADGYWPDGDFVVRTFVRQIQGPQPEEAVVCEMGLLAASQGPPSTFGTAAKVQPFNVPPTGSGTVYYEAAICAWQRGTGNSGSATVNFFCTY